MYQTCVVLLLMSSSTLLCADDTTDLFRDDFSRFPLGKLTEPVAGANAAIQEYQYLPHRGVPLGPWANAICYLDCWAVGREQGGTYLEQYLDPKRRPMVPKLFSPVFLTGDPLWSDYTVEVSVKPMSTDDMAGVVFRYKTNRHHYLFSLQDGNQARLALRLPLEEELEVIRWKELGTVPFEYDSSRYYRLKVETKGTSIRASIDGKLLLTAEDDGLLGGKAGVSANSPARFQDFHVYTAPATKREIDTSVREREHTLAKLRAENPAPRLWKKFSTPQFGTGRSVRFGDLNGDGVPEMLFAQNVIEREQGNFIQISCLTAVTLEGEVLWQMGAPDPANALATYDCAVQIHDIDGDGVNEVVMTKDFTVRILDGQTGQPKKSMPLPQVTQEDRVYYAKSNHPNERYRGDSIAFFNFTGDERRHSILIKDRYRIFWVWDNDLKMLWSGRGQTGHYPYPFHNKTTGYDDLLIGYARWDHNGKQRWTRDAEVTQHADSVAFGNFSGDPDMLPMGYYCCSNEGFVLIDSHGIIRQHHRIGHAQNASVAKLRSDTSGLQYACINYWYNPGIVTLFNYSGDILQQAEPIHSGSPLLAVNWRGDGREFLLLSGNVLEGGMLDGHLRRVVMFPDDGHPDMCAAVLDLTGDRRDEIVLWDPNQVWIYTQDRAFSGKRIYTPHRNPNYNDSNYRASVSLPDWKTLSE